MATSDKDNKQRIYVKEGEKAAPRSLKSSEMISVQHVMPKTYLPRTILHVNTSQERHLQREMNNLENRRRKTGNLLELTKKNFKDRKMRKEKQWKREDEVRVQGMNFPYTEYNPERPGSVEVVYKTPRYTRQIFSPVISGVTLPFMKIKRERTEVLNYREHTFLTKKPTTLEVDTSKLKHHDVYCGTHLLRDGAGVSDERFTRLTQSLAAPVNSSEEEWANNKRLLHISKNPFRKNVRNVILAKKGIDVVYKGITKKKNEPAPKDSSFNT